MRDNDLIKQRRQKMDKTSLGNRMKGNYENVTRYKLPKRTHTIVRLDGKSFHTFTKHFARPYDVDMQTTMKLVTKRLVDEIQGCKLGYTQSDEISLLLTDFDNLKTHAWFDGNLQKMASISASITSVYFNNIIKEFKPDCGDAFFDARVFTIPQLDEVTNYFLWRYKDCVKNSISTLARSVFSHKEVHKLNGSQMIEKMIKEEGIDWNKEQSSFKYGTFITKDKQISEGFVFDSLSNFISDLIS